MMVATHLALLRGINVGGKNKLPMKDLVGMFVEAGCRDVRTYIQSGNVVFSADPDAITPLSGIISGHIADRFGYRVPVIMRTITQLADVLHHNPFLEQGSAEDATLHVMFLADSPAPDRIEGLDPDRSPPDAFIVRGQEIYLRFPSGMATTKLSNAYFDTKLATISTARNWRTVNKLFELMQT